MVWARARQELARWTWISADGCSNIFRLFACFSRHHYIFALDTFRVLTACPSPLCRSYPAHIPPDITL